MCVCVRGSQHNSEYSIIKLFLYCWPFKLDTFRFIIIHISLLYMYLHIIIMLCVVEYEFLFWTVLRPTEPEIVFVCVCLFSMPTLWPIWSGRRKCEALQLLCIFTSPHLLTYANAAFRALEWITTLCEYVNWVALFVHNIHVFIMH